MKNHIGRALKRDKTRLRAKIDCMGQKTHGAILDLSQHGICLGIRSPRRNRTCCPG